MPILVQVLITPKLSRWITTQIISKMDQKWTKNGPKMDPHGDTHISAPGAWHTFQRGSPKICYNWLLTSSVNGKIVLDILQKRPGLTRHPKNSKRAYLSVPALQTPPKFEILGPPPFGPPPFGPPTLRAPHPFGPPTLRAPTLAPTRPPKFDEKTPKRGRTNENCSSWGKQKSKILGGLAGLRQRGGSPAEGVFSLGSNGSWENAKTQNPKI